MSINACPGQSYGDASGTGWTLAYQSESYASSPAPHPLFLPHSISAPILIIFCYSPTSVGNSGNFGYMRNPPSYTPSLTNGGIRFVYQSNNQTTIYWLKSGTLSSLVFPFLYTVFCVITTLTVQSHKYFH